MTTVRLSRPLIGVVPLWDDKLNSLWMLPGYFTASPKLVASR